MQCPLDVVYMQKNVLEDRALWNLRTRAVSSDPRASALKFHNTLPSSHSPIHVPQKRWNRRQVSSMERKEITFGNRSFPLDTLSLLVATVVIWNLIIGIRLPSSLLLCKQFNLRLRCGITVSSAMRRTTSKHGRWAFRRKQSKVKRRKQQLL